MNIAGLILAGGASRRMGSPKALLTFRGETFLDRLIGILAPCCSSVTVVLGHEPEILRAGLKRTSQAEFVVNEQHSLGQFSSLQCGLGALPASDGVLFLPVDYPGVHARTVSRLIEEFRLGDDFVVPRYEDRRGHPMLFAASVIPAFLALPPTAEARQVVHQHVSRTRYVDVEDPGILKDVDYPAAYSELLAQEASGEK